MTDIYHILTFYLLQYVQRRKKFLAHDAKEECHDGDLVIIRECKPYSKRKAFKVTEIIERVESYKDPRTGEVCYQTST